MFVPDDSQQVKDASRKALPLHEAHQKFVDAAKANSAEAVWESQLRKYAFTAKAVSQPWEDCRWRFVEREGGQDVLEQLGGDMSSSADLAYSYGKYTSVATGAPRPSFLSDLAN